jgi:hypothetical protein
MYNFNDNGVCIYPKVAYELDNTDGFVQITIAEYEGKYCYGYKYKYHDPSSQGGESPCMNLFEMYDTEDKAIIAAIDEIIEVRKLFNRITTIKNKLKNFKNDTLFQQLKLF